MEVFLTVFGLLLFSGLGLFVYKMEKLAQSKVFYMVRRDRLDRYVLDRIELISTARAGNRDGKLVVLYDATNGSSYSASDLDKCFKSKEKALARLKQLVEQENSK